MVFPKLPHTWHPSTMAVQNQLNNQIVVRLVVHGENVHVDSNILLFPKFKLIRLPRTRTDLGNTFSASTCVFISPVRLLNQWEISWPATASIGAINSFPFMDIFIDSLTHYPYFFYKYPFLYYFRPIQWGHRLYQEMKPKGHLEYYEVQLFMVQRNLQSTTRDKQPRGNWTKPSLGV